MAIQRRQSKVIKQRVFDLHKQGLTPKQISLQTGYTRGYIYALIKGNKK